MAGGGLGGGIAGLLQHGPLRDACSKGAGKRIACTMRADHDDSFSDHTKCFVQCGPCGKASAACGNDNSSKTRGKRFGGLGCRAQIGDWGGAHHFSLNRVDHQNIDQRRKFATQRARGRHSG